MTESTLTSAEYHHVQVGKVLIAIYGTIIIAATGLGVVTGFHPALLFALLLLVVALIVFATLKVEVNDYAIEVEFYLGFPRKTILLNQVVACRPVKNPWYFGLGIRYTFRGWLFAVSGLSAVEVELASGKLYRIGTDESELLCSAIKQAMIER